MTTNIKDITGRTWCTWGEGLSYALKHGLNRSTYLKIMANTNPDAEGKPVHDVKRRSFGGKKQYYRTEDLARMIDG
jgi:hypothetical protein